MGSDINKTSLQKMRDNIISWFLGPLFFVILGLLLVETEAQIDMSDKVRNQFASLESEMQSAEKSCNLLLPQMVEMHHRIDIGLPLESRLSDFDDTTLSQVAADSKNKALFRQIASTVTANFSMFVPQTLSTGPPTAEHPETDHLEQPKSFLYYLDEYSTAVKASNTSIENFNAAYNASIVSGSDEKEKRFIDSGLSDIFNQCRIVAIDVPMMVPSVLTQQEDSMVERATGRALVRATRFRWLRNGIVIVLFFSLVGAIVWITTKIKGNAPPPA